MNDKIKDYTPRYGLTADDMEKIRCPYCGKDHAWGDEIESGDHDDLVSYWGNDERTEFDCQECSQIFYVQERVSRTYTSFKAEA